MKRELTRRNTLPLFDAFHDDMNRMLENFWDKNFSGMGWSPDVDIAETDKDIIIKAEIPGVDPKDIDISIMDNTLTIKGEKKEEKEDKGKSYHRVERSYGSFTRRIPLPAHVKTDEVEAKDHHGILEITLPKMEKAKAKKITVKTA
ncbi:MAG: Hsp20/alpha crystallin family protein [Candidatus Scalindua sp.]